ncbi:hypothetical protein F4801DRAFT_580251 [Xylaria longipes]|nr:hypothetical protein F4801DRAFT_580251 [Xylaria longipes]
MERRPTISQALEIKSSAFVTWDGKPTRRTVKKAACSQTEDCGRLCQLPHWEETRLGYDQLAVGFWYEVYKHQARLILGYVVEAFAELGCDLGSLQSGDPVFQVTALKKHAQLVSQLYHILEDGKLITQTNQGFSIYQDIVGAYPQHDDVNKLIRAVGSQLAAYLTGEQDGLQVVFGNREAKKTLEAMYEFWLLLRTPMLLLDDMLLKAFTNAMDGGEYITNHLGNHGIPFEYVFTDNSSLLVAAAKKQFKGVDGMSFEVPDIEKPVSPECEGGVLLHHRD